MCITREKSYFRFLLDRYFKIVCVFNLIFLVVLSHNTRNILGSPIVKLSIKPPIIDETMHQSSHLETTALYHYLTVNKKHIYI